MPSFVYGLQVVPVCTVNAGSDSLNFILGYSRGSECNTMDEPTVLRTTKIGGGFVKEDVMTYLDELNSKIVGLEEELKVAKSKNTSAPAADPQEVQKYKAQVDSLQEKLNTSNNALRAAKKENEELQKTINQLKAGGGQGNAQQNAAMAQAVEAAKKEIDTLKNQLRVAEQKAAAGAGQQANAQANAAALEAARKEIDNLRNQLRAVEQKAAAAPTSAANNAELEKARQDIQRINSELNGKAKELADLTHKLEAKTKEAAEKDEKIAALTKEKETVVADKDAEIAKLNDEITDLKENGGGIQSSFDMGALFTEAQKTANKITIEAQKNADKVTSEANAAAEKTTKEANEAAEKTTREANEAAEKTTREAKEEAEKIINDAKIEAETTIANANTTAEKCIKDANEKAKAAIDEANAHAKSAVDEANKQAKDTVTEANSHADKVNEMTKTVRSMLLNEIESVNTKFDDISSVLKRLTGQATERMDEAQLIIGEAKKAVDKGDEDEAIIKKAEAPEAKFEAASFKAADYKSVVSNASSVSAHPHFDKKDDEKKPEEKKPEVKKEETLQSIGELKSEKKPEINNINNSGNSFNNNNNNNFNKSNNNENKDNSNNKSAAAPEQKVPPKKSSNFNFDMAELLKAAEEEAAKNPEE